MLIDWMLLLKALGLMFVLEGLGPLVVPSVWKKAMRQLAEAPPNTLRVLGFSVVLLGMLVLSLARA